MRPLLLLQLFSALIIGACSRSNIVPNQTIILSTGTPIPFIAVTTSVLFSPTPVLPTKTLVPTTGKPILPTITPIIPTPTETSIPTPNLEYLTAQHESGTYLVYTDISPGIWCPKVPESLCEWYTYYPGRNYFKYGSGRGCMTISQVTEVVEWNSICGPWKFLRLAGYMTPLNLLPLTNEDLKSPHGPGEYLVDVHIARGLWEITGQYNCEWAVFDITSNSIIESKSTITKKEVGGTIFISEKAYWVRIGSDCYIMTYLHY
jgi:hypothetical protein